MKNKLLLVLLVIGLAATNLVYAATPTNPSDPDVFLDLAKQFHDAADNWTVTAQNIGYWIFFTLATLEMTWAAALWAMEKDSASSLIVALVRKMMVLGFFYTFLVFAPTWLPAIINSLLGAGEKIGGHAATPGSLIATGLLVIQKLWAAWGNTPVDGIKSFFLSLTAALLLIPVSFIVIFAFVFIAVELIITTIESYIVVGMGLVLMGFSGSQWTRDFSQKYIGYAFSVGVKLMVLTLIVSVIITITNTWPSMIASSLTATDVKSLVYPLFMIAGASVLMALLSIKIPSLASSLLSGAPSLGGAAAVGAAAGAAAGAAGLAVGASKLLGAGASAATTAGGAATKGIAAAAAGGAGMAQAMGAASNLATASGFTPGSSAHMGATAGNMVAGLGGMAATGMSAMAGSAKSAVSGAAKGVAENFKGAVSNSTGGKLAASLDEKAVSRLSSGNNQTGTKSNSTGGNASSTADSSAATVSPPSSTATAFNSTVSAKESISSAVTVPPPSLGGETPAGSGNNPKQSERVGASEHLKKAMKQLPLDHGAVTAAAPKLDHHEP